MDEKQLRKLHNLVWINYHNQMEIVFEDVEEDDFGSYLISRRVSLPKIIIAHPTEWSLFAFLHEVGHIMTNTTKMKRCEQEFLATQWALKEAKRIGFHVPEAYVRVYQQYIWNWHEAGRRLKGRSMKTTEELTLKYPI